MCRLVAYLGNDLVILEDVLVKPVNSLVTQSLKARESVVHTNGDGFGLGWYIPEISDEPALFTSIAPAWGDRNLLSLTSKLKSASFFAHVRAASEGGVTQYNCHPFVFKQWMFMHNGCIAQFKYIKRHLRRIFDDDIYDWIKGDTDSEHLFALFLHCSKGRNLNNLEDIITTLNDTFTTALDFVRKYAIDEPSYFNICLTDGKRMIASRYCSDPTIEPESMHYCTGSQLIDYPHHDLQDAPLMEKKGKDDCVLVSSERLNNVNSEWKKVPKGHYLIVDEQYETHIKRMQIG